MTAVGALTTSTMTSAVVSAPRRVELTRIPIPEPEAGQVLVRVDGCGVCGSNVPTWEGRPWFDYPLEPGAPGHEGWGREVETGAAVAFLGTRSFAEYVAVPREHVVALPAELERRLFPGEAVGCAVNVFVRSAVARSDTVGVVGLGFLGLLLVQLFVGVGARVFGFNRGHTGRQLARAFGAKTPEPHDECCDVVVEAAGVQETLDLAGYLCRTGGRLVVAGFHQDGPRTVDMQLWNWRGVDVINAHERDPAVSIRGVRAAARMVASGLLNPDPLYRVYPIARLNDAFDAAATRPPGFVKSLVRLA
jgi:NADPH2:quinone reductase